MYHIHYDSCIVNLIDLLFRGVIFVLFLYLGGQISIDVFPQGWDKTFCLGLIDLTQFKEVHFFGDKTYPVKHSCMHQCIREGVSVLTVERSSPAN